MGFEGEESLVLNVCHRNGLLPATRVREIPSREVALGASIVEAGSARTVAGAALVVATKYLNILKVHRMLAHPSEDITQRTADPMGIVTIGQWGSFEACLPTNMNHTPYPE